MNLRKGLSLTELTVVVAIVSILAIVALPKFQDLFLGSKEKTTQSTLISLRSALAIKYAKSSIGDSKAVYPESLQAADFSDGKEPKNMITGNSGVMVLDSIPSGTAVSSKGFWYIRTGEKAGRAGAFSNGKIDTSGY